MNVDIARPNTPKKQITYRKYHNINVEKLNGDIKAAISNIDLESSIDELLNTYDSILKGMMDIHAPLQTKTITPKNKSSWFNIEIQEAKSKRSANWNVNGGKQDHLLITRITRCAAEVTTNF